MRHRGAKYPVHCLQLNTFPSFVIAPSNFPDVIPANILDSLTTLKQFRISSCRRYVSIYLKMIFNVFYLFIYSAVCRSSGWCAFIWRLSACICLAVMRVQHEWAMQFNDWHKEKYSFSEHSFHSIQFLVYVAGDTTQGIQKSSNSVQVMIIGKWLHFQAIIQLVDKVFSSLHYRTNKSKGSTCKIVFKAAKTDFLDNICCFYMDPSIPPIIGIVA